MAEAVSATYDLKLSVDHTIALTADFDDPTITHDIGDVRGTLDASSTITATKAWSDTVTCAAGVSAIDMTALDMGDAPDEDFTGLKIVLYKISCPSTNTHGVLFDIGGINPYDLFGDATGQVMVLPGQCIEAYLADQAEAVGAGAKAMAISSGMALAEYSIILVAGG